MTNQNEFQLITNNRFHPNEMYADHENLILWYLLIQWSDLRIGHTLVIIRISRSFLWYVMNDLIHEMQLRFLGYLKWSFQSSSKIKLWMQNWVSTNWFSWVIILLVFFTFPHHVIWLFVFNLDLNIKPKYQLG